MAKPRHDWYAAHWAKLYGWKQAQIARDLEWNTAKVSLTFSGKQAYSRDDVNELAELLNLEPFELLMPPERAMNLRQLRASAEQITKLVAAPTKAVPQFESPKVDKVHADRRDSPHGNGKAAKKFR